MNKQKRYRSARRLSKEICDQICHLYVNEKMSSKETAETLGLYGPTVIGVLRRLNIPRRSKSEAIKLAFSRGRKIRPKGERNPNWKGGTKEQSGYFMLWMPNYHRQTKKGYIYQHIYVWEQAHGKLPNDWVIHHLNGIKDDNRLENLLAMPRKNHKPNLLLDAVKKRLRKVEQELKSYKNQTKMNL